MEKNEAGKADKQADVGLISCELIRSNTRDNQELYPFKPSRPAKLTDVLVLPDCICYVCITGYALCSSWTEVQRTSLSAEQ